MSALPAVPPHLAFTLTDWPRAFSELGWFYSVRRWLERQQDGDGRPVLVIPGLNAADWTTQPLRAVMMRQGYTPYGWRLGTNVGPTGRAVAGLDDLLGRIHTEHQSPVTVVGQSLGGYMGAELARRHPDKVDRLITLGSPITMTSTKQSRASRIYDKHRSEHLPEFEFSNWSRASPPEIPCSSIYSRGDGIVQWRACQWPKAPLTENIEVYSSHLGMAVQPAAVYATLDRLAAPLDNWAPFHAPRRLRLYFPEPRAAA